MNLTEKLEELVKKINVEEFDVTLNVKKGIPLIKEVRLFNQGVHNKEQQYDLYHEWQDDPSMNEIDGIFGEFFDADKVRYLLFGVDKTVKISQCHTIQVCEGTSRYKRALEAGLLE